VQQRHGAVRCSGDRQRINVHQDYDVEYWTKELAVTKERLEQLVQEHGDRADDVRRALAKQMV
jgi:Protein of unknown function (DUF3606)